MTPYHPADLALKKKLIKNCIILLGQLDMTALFCCDNQINDQNTRKYTSMEQYKTNTTIQNNLCLC